MHEAFRDLHAATREALSRLADEWAAGHLSAGMFTSACDEVLLEAHTQAVVIGRTHAGDDTPQETDDRRFAEAIVEEERDYLRGFRRDLDEGRYLDDDGHRNGAAVTRRVESYAGRVTGTANEAWSLALPSDTLLWWRLQSEEGACTDCPELADASPWTPGELVAHPGGNQTSCLQNCRCDLVTEAGQRGFVTPG